MIGKSMNNKELVVRDSVPSVLKTLALTTLVVALAACNGTPAGGNLDAAHADNSPASELSDSSAAPSHDASNQAPATAAMESPRYAAVVSVQPIRQRINHEHQECRDEAVTRKVRPDDKNQIAGTVIGAVAGGVIGNQVGGGRGRDLTTVAGAIGGGAAGKHIQKQQQNKRTVTTIEQRCRTVNEPSEEIVAYDVVYEHLGTTHNVRLDHDPGDRVQLPVRGID